MATVTGSLRTFGLANINYLDPVIKFEANKPAVGQGGKFIVTDPVTAVPDATDSTFTVDLEPTDQLITQGVYYKVTVEWRDPADNYVRADLPDWRLYVPSAGGAISDLIGQDINPGLVITAPTAPVTWLGVAALWLQMDPADPNNPDNPANTGDLYELRNT